MTDTHLPQSLPECLGQRATRHGDRIAVTFRNDDGLEHSWSYAQLWSKACGLAARLPSVPDDPAPRGVLLFPPGIEFLVGFVGCQIAGWIPVPTCYPKPGREMPRLDSAATDCHPSALIADSATLDGIATEKLGPAVRDLPRVATDREPHDDNPALSVDQLSIDPQSLALLQYTSGSTSDPKGVMVSHRGMMANLEAIRRGFQIEFQPDQGEPKCGAFWLPFFHDMGLIGGILEPLYLGGRTILMSPRSFLQRPVSWLKLISDYGAVISGAPNFAFQLCVDRISPEDAEPLDLSGWQVAFSGAEPVLPRTLEAFSNRFSANGFSAEAFYPCYGLAEATLLAAGGAGPGHPDVIWVNRDSLAEGRPVIDTKRSQRTVSLVSCGRAAYRTQLKLVDPTTCREVGENVVGEIWLHGDSVSGGYWNREQENTELFNAQLEGDPAGYCRSGDLGFMHLGKLYITGRIKDVIILRGRNLFPQDIETTVRDVIGSEAGQCAAFAVDGPRGETLAIIAETPRRAEAALLPGLVRDIRRQVIDNHEVDPHHVLLVRPATVPLTSSGKVRRSHCRDLFESDRIKTKHRYDRRSASEQSPLPIPQLPENPSQKDRDAILLMTEQWMATWMIVRAGVDPQEVDLNKPFAEYGLDSLTAVEMSGEIEDWSDVELTPVVAWSYPTVSKMSAYITDQILDLCEPANPADDVSNAELENLLDEIEQLSDDEIDHALAEKPRD